MFGQGEDLSHRRNGVQSRRLLDTIRESEQSIFADSPDLDRETPRVIGPEPSARQRLSTRVLASREVLGLISSIVLLTIIFLICVISLCFRFKRLVLNE